MVWAEKGESFKAELFFLKTHRNALIKEVLHLENPAGKCLISVEIIFLLMEVDLF